MRPHRSTDRPFSVVVCTSCSSDRVLAALAALRATVKRCPHGMLVRADCLLGSPTCVRRPAGVTIVLQPCSIDRVPVGSAMWLRPINRPDDVQTVCDFIERGVWELETVDAVRAN